MHERIFSPASARRALQLLRPAAESMCRLYRALEHLRPEEIEGDQPVDGDYFTMASRLSETVTNLREAGVQVKDPKIGLIDFPARRNGRPVLLCWKVGEPSVAHWHEIDAGFAGRQPLDDAGPWEDAAGEVGRERS